MLQVRKGVFETNSSSIHTLTIATEDEFNDFIDGKLFYNEDNCKLLTREEVEEIIRKAFNDDLELFVIAKDILKDRKYLDDDSTDWTKLSNENLVQWWLEVAEACWLDSVITNYDTYGWHGYCMYEHYDESFTTPSGDKMVAFGYFGHD